MKRERIVRPSVSRLERMVAAARERAGEDTFRALSPLMDEVNSTLASVEPGTFIRIPPDR